MSPLLYSRVGSCVITSHVMTPESQVSSPPYAGAAPAVAAGPGLCTVHGRITLGPLALPLAGATARWKVMVATTCPPCAGIWVAAWAGAAPAPVTSSPPPAAATAMAAAAWAFLKRDIDGSFLRPSPDAVPGNRGCPHARPARRHGAETALK